MLFFAVFYVIGIPAGSAFLLYKNRHILQPDDISVDDLSLRDKAESFQKTFGSLYEAYDAEVKYFY